MSVGEPEGKHMVQNGARDSAVRTLLTVGVLAASLALSACTAAAVESTPRPTASASSSATPVPELDPTGDAADNLAFFDSVNRALLATTPQPNGRQIVDNLVAAGFAKADMEITPDVTIGKEAAESIQFSVRIGDSCLIGQTGGAGYNAVAAPLLGTGKCLIGTTRTIDW
jgi:hypothetical protein